MKGFTESSIIKAMKKLFGTYSGYFALPEENEYILICNSQGTMEICYYHIDDTFYPNEYADLNETGWYDRVDDALCFEPIAWMPLPKPYEPQESEV